METSAASEPVGPALAPILNRTLPGGCLPANRGTLAWGQDGLLAYGAHSTVVVVEPATVQVLRGSPRIRRCVPQVLQCLARHRAPVVALAWGRVEARRLQLASADSSGEVTVLPHTALTLLLRPRSWRGTWWPGSRATRFAFARDSSRVPHTIMSPLS
jgi:hypothetical protein